METVSLIIKIVLCIFSVFLIVVVLLQSGNRGGAAAALGGAEMAFGKTKARGMDALLAKLTKVSAIGFMILAVALVILNRFVA